MADRFVPGNLPALLALPTLPAVAVRPFRF
jgi:hypothetical protein